jgi:hypothetical protein
VSPHQGGRTGVVVSALPPGRLCGHVGAYAAQAREPLDTRPRPQKWGQPSTGRPMAASTAIATNSPHR